MATGFQGMSDTNGEILGKHNNIGGCRRCGLCLPCPQDINIPRLFLYEQYAVVYRQIQWAARQYAQVDAQGDQCVGCGICELFCPYSIKISKGMERVHTLLSIEQSRDAHEARLSVLHCETFSLDKIHGPFRTNGKG